MQKNIASLMEKHFPEDVCQLLKRIGVLAGEHNFLAYGVGGFIRDVFLNWKNLDLDISLEGDGLQFTKILASQLGARVYFYPKYLTAYLILSDGLRIDIATARQETYSQPAVMPVVTASSMQKDLRRRDFTLNAIAVSLHPRNYGTLYDPFAGQKDLAKKLVRVLHEKSFIDDPTRIFRALRFASRYHFAIEQETNKLLLAALKRNLPALLSPHRLRDELQAILDEPQAEAILQQLENLGVLKYFHPELKMVSPWPDLTTAQEGLAFLLQPLPEKEKKAFFVRLGWPKKERK
ncbi:MAG: hypothetical protein ABII74_00655 [Elusimicrobiota bacterium]